MKLNKKDYTAAAFIIGVFFFMFAFSFYAIAGDYHHNTYNTPVVETEPAINNTVINYNISASVAKAMASSQIHPNYGVYKLQGGVGFGFDGDETAIAAGLSMRFKNTLLSTTASCVPDKLVPDEKWDCAYGAGANWTF